MKLKHAILVLAQNPPYAIALVFALPVLVGTAAACLGHVEAAALIFKSISIASFAGALAGCLTASILYIRARLRARRSKAQHV